MRWSCFVVVWRTNFFFNCIIVVKPHHANTIHSFQLASIPHANNNGRKGIRHLRYVHVFVFSSLLYLSLSVCLLVYAPHPHVKITSSLLLPEQIQLIIVKSKCWSSFLNSWADSLRWKPFLLNGTVSSSNLQIFPSRFPANLHYNFVFCHCRKLYCFTMEQWRIFMLSQDGRSLLLRTAGMTWIGSTIIIMNLGPSSSTVANSHHPVVWQIIH